MQLTAENKKIRDADREREVTMPMSQALRYEQPHIFHDLLKGWASIIMKQEDTPKLKSLPIPISVPSIPITEVSIRYSLNFRHVIER